MNAQETILDDIIVRTYCLCDDFLRSINHRDDPQATMSTAEVMLVPIIGAYLFSTNIDKARIMLKTYHYIPQMLSKSRLNRRIHQIPFQWWQTFFERIGNAFKQINYDNNYIIDSMPIAVCDNRRIPRVHLFRDDKAQYQGRIASKKRFFFGIKIHLLTTAAGRPVEVALAPGCYHDNTVFKQMDRRLPEGSNIFADKGYTDYKERDRLYQQEGIRLLVPSKRNSKQPHPSWLEKFIYKTRKRIETTFSQLASRLPRSIHAVTERGFIIKVITAVIALAIAFIR